MLKDQISHLKLQFQSMNSALEKTQIENEKLLKIIEYQKIESSELSSVFQIKADEKLEKSIHSLHKEFLKLTDELNGTSAQKLKLISVVQKQSEALEYFESFFGSPEFLQKENLISELILSLSKNFDQNLISGLIQTLNRNDLPEKTRFFIAFSDLLIQQQNYHQQINRFSLYLSSILIFVDQILSFKDVQQFQIQNHFDKESIKINLHFVLDQIGFFMKKNSLPISNENVSLLEVSSLISKIIDGLSVSRDPIALEALNVISLLAESNEILMNFSKQLQEKVEDDVTERTLSAQVSHLEEVNKLKEEIQNLNESLLNQVNQINETNLMNQKLKESNIKLKKQLKKCQKVIDSVDQLQEQIGQEFQESVAKEKHIEKAKFMQEKQNLLDEFQKTKAELEKSYNEDRNSLKKKINELQKALDEETNKNKSIHDRYYELNNDFTEKLNSSRDNEALTRKRFVEASQENSKLKSENSSLKVEQKMIKLQLKNIDEKLQREIANFDSQSKIKFSKIQLDFENQKQIFLKELYNRFSLYFDPKKKITNETILQAIDKFLMNRSAMNSSRTLSSRSPALTKILDDSDQRYIRWQTWAKQLIAKISSGFSFQKDDQEMRSFIEESVLNSFSPNILKRKLDILRDEKKYLSSRVKESKAEKKRIQLKNVAHVISFVFYLQKISSFQFSKTTTPSGFGVRSYSNRPQLNLPLTTKKTWPILVPIIDDPTEVN